MLIPAQRDQMRSKTCPGAPVKGSVSFCQLYPYLFPNNQSTYSDSIIIVIKKIPHVENFF